MDREGHSLQSLLLGIHTDVCLHLNAPQTQQAHAQLYITMHIYAHT